ncbi:MAG: hypothetical protein H6707_20070 [Deltaproteobacteria bacterium]|nr:hypothetical protein [Deltaproteobacteria bacterium]
MSPSPSGESRLRTLDGESWAAHLAAPLAVLVLGKSDCAACSSWTEELAAFLESDAAFGEVAFGKLLLDQRGLTSFKRENPWLAEVDALPFNVIYKAGQRVKSYAGGGIERLTGRLESLR